MAPHSKLIHFGLYCLTCCLVITAAVILPSESLNICSSEDPSDCYPVDFIPTREWQIIKEGQVIPPGLDIRLDWQTGVKSAKLGDSMSGEEVHEKGVVVKEVEENKIVHYLDDDDDDNHGGEDIDDEEIEALKVVAQGSGPHLDLEDAIDFISNGVYENKQALIDSLDSLTEYSHDLQDGITISQAKSMKPLIDLALGEKYGTKVREMALRTIAQSLRHNPEALANVDINEVLPVLMKSLESEDESVLQKRILGVVSSLIQNEANAYDFSKLDGRQKILDVFPHLYQDSQLRSLEILDDLDKHVVKRGDDSDFNEKLFNTIQESFVVAREGQENTSSFETIFDKLVELKVSNKSFRTGPRFLQWLADEVQRRKTNGNASEKRDGNDEALLKKLTDARHLVFGNPMGLRKAYADEL